MTAPRARVELREAAVRKHVPPGEDPDGSREAYALRAFGGRAAARLLEHDPARGVLVIERLRPGTPLRDAGLDDDAATLALAGVMPRLWVTPAPGHPLPDMRERGRALWSPESATLDPQLTARARDEYEALCASAAEPVVLHADLHHLNLLRDGAGWRAIDPKGVVGEPAYEPGALLRNPIGARLSAATMRRRIALLAEVLGLDGERIRRWGFAQAVLSAAWSLQDGEDSAWWLHCAELLR